MDLFYFVQHPWFEGGGQLLMNLCLKNLRTESIQAFHKGETTSPLGPVAFNLPW